MKKIKILTEVFLFCLTTSGIAAQENVFNIKINKVLSERKMLTNFKSKEVLYYNGVISIGQGKEFNFKSNDVDYFNPWLNDYSNVYKEINVVNIEPNHIHAEFNVKEALNSRLLYDPVHVKLYNKGKMIVDITNGNAEKTCGDVYYYYELKQMKNAKCELHFSIENY